MKYKRYLLFSYMVGLISLTAQSMRIQSSEIKPIIRTVLLPDTTEYGEDTDLKANDTINKTKGNLAKGTLNALDYRMDTRYFALGDSLGKQKWYRDIFLQLGMGVENIMAPTESYKFNTLNTFHFAVGKQFGKYHSLRLQGDVVLGYQQFYDRMYQRLGVQLDHLFNASSYLCGYNPSRILEVGTVIGLGHHRARLRRTGRLDYPYEAHGGLQFRFYTGPHGVFNIEPYIMLATDDIDLSQNRNWRRHDAAFGVNANFVYYFDNHLSRAARNRILTNSKDKNPNRITSDSTRLYSWQAPWQFDIAAGVSVMNIPEMSFRETMGYECAFSVGKWFSPVIGLRATAVINANKGTNTSFYAGTRAEGMFNPLGFLRSFRWDAPVGFYIVGGAGIGRLVKRPDLRCWSESYSAGLHLWARLTDGLQVFVEPRYTYRRYNVPYKNVQWLTNFSDQFYGVDAGFTVTGASRVYRRYETAKGERRPRMAAGLGGGIHLLPSSNLSEWASSMPYNMNAFFEYRMSNVSAARLALGFVRHNTSGLTRYRDLNMNVSGYAPVLRNGLWNYTYYLGLTTLNYSLNLTNAFCGYRTKRLFNLEAFAGPGVVWTLGRRAVLDARETLPAGHEARLLSDTSRKMCVAANGGVKLTANVYRGFGITFTPQLYYIPGLQLQGVSLSRLKALGTLDLGLQYQF